MYSLLPWVALVCILASRNQWWLQCYATFQIFATRSSILIVCEPPLYLFIFAFASTQREPMCQTAVVLRSLLHSLSLSISLFFLSFIFIFSFYFFLFQGALIFYFIPLSQRQNIETDKCAKRRGTHEPVSGRQNTEFLND